MAKKIALPWEGTELAVPYDWVQRMFDAKPYTAPDWMQALVKRESLEAGKFPPPVVKKFVPWKQFMGGYTTHSLIGEIALVYGDEPEMEDELETLIHELVHWIVGAEQGRFGGHTPKYYAELTKYALKYDIDFDRYQLKEFRYMGSLVYEGISMYHQIYNEGDNDFDKSVQPPKANPR